MSTGLCCGTEMTICNSECVQIARLTSRCWSGLDGAIIIVVCEGVAGAVVVGDGVCVAGAVVIVVCEASSIVVVVRVCISCAIVVVVCVCDARAIIVVVHVGVAGAVVIVVCDGVALCRRRGRG